MANFLEGAADSKRGHLIQLEQLKLDRVERELGNVFGMSGQPRPQYVTEQLAQVKRQHESEINRLKGLQGEALVSAMGLEDFQSGIIR